MVTKSAVLPEGTEFELCESRAELRSAGIGDRPGCYAVFDEGGQCLYVGGSKRLLTRICAHWIDQRDGEGRRWRLAGTVEWYFAKPSVGHGTKFKVWETVEYKALEKALIAELKPSYNREIRRPQSIKGSPRVLVRLSNGTERIGIVRGESMDKEAWRLQLEGHSFYTVENYHKSRCTPLDDEETKQCA